MFNAKQVKKDMVAWIRSYFERNGTPRTKAVIGISGGADSSIDAALCKEALGVDRVVGVRMPNGTQTDIDAARGVADALGIECHEINIKPIVDAFYAALREAGFEPNYTVTSNTPSRIRTAMLYAVSAVIDGGGRVCNNGNLTENYLGWMTKGGDTVGDFAPIRNLVKREVVQVGRETELEEVYVVKIPEDGLSGRTDEENFGFPYSVADTYIRDGKADDMGVVAEIQVMHERGLHKQGAIPSFPYLNS